MGGSLAGQPAGTLGDVGVLSFGGSKLVTAGRGGAILTRDPLILQRIRVFGHVGNDAFPLSEIQAAVLRPQIKDLAKNHDRRSQRTSADLLARLSTCPGIRWSPSATEKNWDAAYYKLGVWWDPDWTRGSL